MNPADPLYRELILTHAQAPHGSGVLEPADLDLNFRNRTCGDRVQLSARLANGRVSELRCQTDGCALATAGSSLLCDYAPGTPLAQLVAMDDDTALRALGLDFVTPARRPCALLAIQALRDASA